MRREPSILHVDLDAMFAAVEQRDKVSLRGVPVIVGGVAGRGVVSTASYEARKFGAHSAMPMAQARRLCPPNTAFLSPRFPAYQRTSAVVMKLLAGVSPLVEQVSIDEAYIDLAAADHDLSLRGVTELAHRLKAEIAVATGGVTGSIGAASSKLLAKIGSDLNKPDGVTIVPAGDELAVLHPLPVRRLGGVGPATELRLHRSGIRTVGDLAARPLDDLVDWFGTAHGHGLYRLARAQDNRPVVSEREAKSVSAEETFDVDLTDPGRLNRELDLLAARVAGRLRRSGLTGRTVNIKLRHPDFTTVTRAVTRDQPTDDGRLIAQLARRLLAELDTSGGVRLLGVGVSTLADFAQDDLFTAAGEDPPFFSFTEHQDEDESGDRPPTSPASPLPPFSPSPSPSLAPTSPVPRPSALPSAAPTPETPSALAVPPAVAVPGVPSELQPPPVLEVPGASVLRGPPDSAVPGVTPRPPSPLAVAVSGAPSASTSPPTGSTTGVPSAFTSPPTGSTTGVPSVSTSPPTGSTTGVPSAFQSPPTVSVPGVSSLSDSLTAATPGASSASAPMSASSSSLPSAQVSSPSVSPVPVASPTAAFSPLARRAEIPTSPVWRPGQDVRHDDYGPGWVRGSGIGRVTVRFEGPHTPPGRVRTFFVDDPALHPADPPDWTVPGPPPPE